MNKTIICLAIFAAIALNVALAVDENWEAWKRNHNLQFKSAEEEKKKYDAFVQNRAFIYQSSMLRSSDTGFTMELNNFATLTPEEIKSNFLTLRIPKKVKEANRDAEFEQEEQDDDDDDVESLNADEAFIEDDEDDFQESAHFRAKAYRPYFVRTFTTKKPTTRKPTTKKPTTKPPTKPPTTPIVAAQASQGLPESIDWRKEGAVTGVKQQGGCGSCWAFVTTGALEGRMKVKTGQLVSLSEQNLVDCNKYDMNCGGGWMNDALLAVRDQGGINAAAAYAYKGVKSKTCLYNKTASAVYAKVQSKPYQTIQSTDTALMQALQGGPVMAAMDASRRTFHFYKSGIYQDGACNKANIDHAVLIIGYGTDQSSGKPYWLLKNSWGTGWGEQGYFRLPRGSNVCGLLSYLSVPILA